MTYRTYRPIYRLSKGTARCSPKSKPAPISPSLPFYVLAALNFKVVSGLRRPGPRSRKASRKQLIQSAVARAIREQAISLGLGREILEANRAYGPKGKKALKEFA